MKILILPMLVHEFKNGQNGHVVGPYNIKNIIENMLGPPKKVSAEYSEYLSLNIFHLAMLLLKYLPNELVGRKIELEKLEENCLT